MLPVPTLRAPRISTLLVNVEEAFALETKRLPAIASCAEGEVVPMPTSPFESITNAVEVAKPDVEEATENRCVVCPAFPATESVAYGDEVPMPKSPAVVMTRVLVAPRDPLE